MNSKFNPINIPYNWCMNVSDPQHRNPYPGSDVLGNGSTFCNQNMGLAPGLYYPPTLGDIAIQNGANVAKLDNSFLYTQSVPNGTPQYTTPQFAPPSLQEPRIRDPYKNLYILKAAEALHIEPDPVMAIFFSDSNIDHLLSVVVKKVKEITAESGITTGDKPEEKGVDIMKPNMKDFFNYMIYFYQNYKGYNGSPCFINLRNKNETVQDAVGKLNSSVLQEYISKMVSQIKMYIYYYIDASQLPEQLSNPVLTSMKGSRSLEYNTGFYSGNSIGVASYNEVGNIN